MRFPIPRTVITVHYAANRVSSRDLLIYFDQGVSWFSVAGTISSLRKVVDLPSYNIRLVSSEYVNHAHWGKQAALFVMPGGRTVPHYKRLADGGNENIRAFVRQGGKYLGLCAGGYYGSHHTLFEKGTPLELELFGPLGFFKGTAVGPAYNVGEFRYCSKRGARQASLSWNKTYGIDGTTVSYYNGGCLFSGSALESAAILASYADIKHFPAAIIETPVDKGKAVLSGVHFEMSAFWSSFPSLWEASRKYDTLRGEESKRLDTVRAILSRLDIKV